MSSLTRSLRLNSLKFGVFFGFFGIIFSFYSFHLEVGEASRAQLVADGPDSDRGRKPPKGKGVNP